MEPLFWKSILFYFYFYSFYNFLNHEAGKFGLSTKKSITISSSFVGIIYRTISSIMSICCLFEYLSEEEWIKYQFATIGFYFYTGVLCLSNYKLFPREDILFSMSHFVFGLMVYFLFEENPLIFSVLYLSNIPLSIRHGFDVYFSLGLPLCSIHLRYIIIKHFIYLFSLFFRLYIFSHMIVLSLIEDNTFMFFGSFFSIYAICGNKEMLLLSC